MCYSLYVNIAKLLMLCLVNEQESDVQFGLVYCTMLNHSIIYMSISNLLPTLEKSLRYIRNSNYPNIDPCGTLVVIESLLEVIFLHKRYLTLQLL